MEAAEKQREKNQKCWGEEVDISGAICCSPSSVGSQEQRTKFVSPKGVLDTLGAVPQDKVQLRWEIEHLESWWDSERGKPLGPVGWWLLDRVSFATSRHKLPWESAKLPEGKIVLPRGYRGGVPNSNERQRVGIAPA